MNNNCSKKQYNIDIEKDKNNNKEQTLMPIMNYSFWILFGFFGIFYILFTQYLNWQHKKIIILSLLPSYFIYTLIRILLSR